MGTPSVYPTGTTIYDPEKAWSGYTLMPVSGIGAILIDMNGNVIKVWKDFQGFPNKLLKGGYCMGSLGRRDAEYAYQDMADLTQVDWDGNIVWSFNKKEFCKDGDKEYWLARQHHDYQREGNPVGYYVPGMECKTDSGNTLMLEVMDYFYYNGQEFAALCDAQENPSDDEPDDDPVYIMQVNTFEDENGEEMEEFVPPEEALMEKLIQVVRTRFTDEEDEDDEE